MEYIKLFWYFASNWNPRLALFLLSHEIRGEKKYGINTTKPVELKDLTIKKGNIRQSSRYEAVNYYILENLLQKLTTLVSPGTFVDLGCGKGRAMVVAAHYGFKTIKGIDFAEEMCREAEQNLDNLRSELDVDFTIVPANVPDYTIQPDDSVFFMFNPFAKETIIQFLDNLEESLLHHPRDIYFLYVSPSFVEIFFDYEYEPVYRKRKLKWLDGVILKKEYRIADLKKKQKSQNPNITNQQ
ncbi:MAG: class I SAM-dependent methyltransferase [Chitinophagaceae bacterium]|nr:class I SAM-dependent methyltransferase [Chitinophagaceae bacterium]MCW5925863.1 class I SAM-dependent methyltransferase [Chitinophagaceae bacterium]